MRNQALGTVIDKEVTIAEAPEDTDAVKACVVSGLYIDIDIADIDSILLPYPKGF